MQFSFNLCILVAIELDQMFAMLSWSLTVGNVIWFVELILKVGMVKMLLRILCWNWILYLASGVG